MSFSPLVEFLASQRAESILRLDSLRSELIYVDEAQKSKLLQRLLERRLAAIVGSHDRGKTKTACSVGLDWRHDVYYGTAPELHPRSVFAQVEGFHDAIRANTLFILDDADQAPHVASEIIEWFYTNSQCALLVVSRPLFSSEADESTAPLADLLSEPAAVNL